MRKAITAYKTSKGSTTVTWWTCPTKACDSFFTKTNIAPAALMAEEFSCQICSKQWKIVALQDNVGTVRLIIESR